MVVGARRQVTVSCLPIVAIYSVWGQLHVVAILRRTESRPANSNVLSLGDIFPAYTFTNIWPLAGIERRRRTTSPGNARDLAFSAGFQRASTGGSSLIRYVTVTSPSCLQEPTVEIVSSVRRVTDIMGEITARLREVK